jgi:tetratricopeptide (TPR) repeat protein
MFKIQNMDRINRLIAMQAENTNDPFLIYAIGLEYNKLNQWSEADVWFSKLDHQPEYLPRYFHHGRCLLQLNRHSDAISVFEKGKEVAKRQGDYKTASEINEVLISLGVSDED